MSWFLYMIVIREASIYVWSLGKKNYTRVLGCVYYDTACMLEYIFHEFYKKQNVT